MPGVPMLALLASMTVHPPPPAPRIALAVRIALSLARRRRMNARWCKSAAARGPRLDPLLLCVSARVRPHSHHPRGSAPAPGGHLRLLGRLPPRRTLGQWARLATVRTNASPPPLVCRHASHLAPPAARHAGVSHRRCSHCCPRAPALSSPTFTGGCNVCQACCKDYLKHQAHHTSACPPAPAATCCCLCPPQPALSSNPLDGRTTATFASWTSARCSAILPRVVTTLAPRAVR